MVTETDIDQLFHFDKVDENITKNGLNFARKYKIENMFLSTVQYRYDEGQTSASMNLIRQGGYNQKFLETIM